jgi:hypothetical protein
MHSFNARSSFQPQFQNFLYAAIDDDEHGMPLSVLSALSQMNIDPWAEAATLARLPYAQAVSQLRSLIAKVPSEPLKPRDLDVTVKRLLALLPRSGPPSAARAILNAVAPPDRFSALRYGILIGTMMTTQWLVTSCHSYLTNAAHPDSPALSTEQTPAHNENP